MLEIELFYRITGFQVNNIYGRLDKPKSHASREWPCHLYCSIQTPGSHIGYDEVDVVNTASGEGVVEFDKVRGTELGPAEPRRDIDRGSTNFLYPSNGNGIRKLQE